MKRKKPLTAKSPADHLFDESPEHAREVYRQHKAHKRAKDRKDYMDVMRGKDVINES